MPVDLDHRTIAVDFDGVLHQFTTPWTDKLVIPDPPVPGAIQWLESVVTSFTVIIHSCRFTPESDSEEDLKRVKEAVPAVQAWFASHGLPAEVLEKLEFWTATGKPYASLYIDDRGLRFTGRFPSADVIDRMWTWKHKA